MNKALLLIDIQNDYFKGGKSELVEPDKALKNTKAILDYFREKKLPVIHVQHINKKEDATFFLPNTYGVEIHKTVSPFSNENIVIKHTPNSFFETNLAKLIKEKEINELVVCGMMSHMCIDTTVRSAKDYNIPITLIWDACATKNLNFNGDILLANQINKVMFASLNAMFATILSSKELLHELVYDKNN